MFYLGRDKENGEWITLALSAMLKGLYLIGRPGSGKTTLLHTIISQAHKGYGLCLLDIHRDLTDSFLSCISQERENDAIVWDMLDPTHTVGLNSVESINPNDFIGVSRILSSVMAVFAKLFTESGDLAKEAPTMAETLQMTIPVLLANPGMTLIELPLLLMNETARKKLLAPVQSPYICAWWEQYQQMKLADQEALTGSTRRRLTNFLTDPLISDVIGQSETTLPFRKLMDEKKILIIKLSREHEVISSLIGSVIVLLLSLAAFSRSNIPEKQRVPFILCVDEAQLFDIPALAELLSEARKEKIATIVAHQFRDQLSRENRGATLNAGNLISFSVSGEDATELAKQFDATPRPPDVIGSKPILTVKQDVINHLCIAGHVNPAVTSFVNEYLIPARRVVEQNRRGNLPIRVSPCPGVGKHKLLITDLDEAIHQLNTLLLSVMTDADEGKIIPPFVFGMFSRLFGFSRGLCWYITLINYVSGNPMPSFFHARRPLTLLCSPDLLLHKEELAQTVPSRRLKQALSFLYSLRQTMHVLSVDPILVGTGQHEPIYDKPRTYADVQNEIATKLANLPPFTARVKIIGVNGKPVEHTLQTLSASSLGLTELSEPELQARKARIHANNIAQGYLVERTVVRQSIVERHSYLTQPDKRHPSRQEDEEE